MFGCFGGVGGGGMGGIGLDCLAGEFCELVDELIVGFGLLSLR
jgi:hypothetical protein